MGSLESTEAECAAGRTAPRVSLDDIKANIAAMTTFRGGDAFDPDQAAAHPSLNVLTICILVLRNGFTIIGKSAPASADNFHAALGEKLAYEDAVRQVWPLMGYELRQRLYFDAANSALRKAFPGMRNDATPYADLPEHMQRVAVERDELSDRLTRLQSFLDGDGFKGLSPEQQADLVDQQAHMCAYLARLNIRLAR